MTARANVEVGDALGIALTQAVRQVLPSVLKEVLPDLLADMGIVATDRGGAVKTADAAALLACSQSRVNDLVNAGTLEAIEPEHSHTRGRLILRRSIDAYLDSQAARSATTRAVAA